MDGGRPAGAASGRRLVIIRLGVAGIVAASTSRRRISRATTRKPAPSTCRPRAVQRCPSDGRPTDPRWTEILPRTALEGDTHNLFAVDAAIAATHLRLRIFPDGGVARLHVHGEVVPDWARLRRRGEIDLAAAEHGGIVVVCSDMFFGSRHNLIMPGDARHMGDGWETKRRRGPGHDWTIVRLGAPGTISRVEVDTRHFKGNAPGACSLEACVMEGTTADLLTNSGVEWRELMPRRVLQPHVRHIFDDDVAAIGEMTHARFNIFPDGGVGRLRLYGKPR